MTIWRANIATPVGTLTAYASEAGLKALLWAGAQDKRFGIREAVKDGALPLLERLARQLTEYFDGTRRVFDLPLRPEGTEFQRLAWEALRAIPYGSTRTYREQAEAIGRARAVRAIGAANGRNPLPIIVPCHRVIGADGSLTGFGGGLDIKRFLLDLEAAQGSQLPLLRGV
jgi:methylated-DNA-[protein]-cysteine S-methyltransferase